MYPVYKCNTLEEVKKYTDKLDKAKLVELEFNNGGVKKTINKYRGIYNISTDELANVATKGYKLVSHKKYIDSFAQALNRLNIKFKMDIKPSYNKVYCDIIFPNKKHKYDNLNEEFLTGIRLVNSYDKSTGIGIMPKLTRLACTNGMILTRNEKSFSVKHTNNILEEIESFIEKRINNIIDIYDDLKGYVNNCMKDSIEWKIVTKISEKLFVQLKHREEVLKKLNITVIKKDDKEKNKKKVEYVNEIKNRKKITRWDFYNAITSYLTHGEQITPFLEQHYQRKAEKVLTTPFLKLPKNE